jgi:heme exporter protein C
MHFFANPHRFLGLAKHLSLPLLLLGSLLAAIGSYAGLRLVPPELYQGEAVRILYIHVPSAMLGMGGWLGIAVASLSVLVWRHPLAGIAARASADVGMVFTALCLVTGSLWGRPSWGTYWQWDGRMSTMLILLFMYLGYTSFAKLQEEAGGNMRLNALYGLFGALILPVIHFSVEWWNTLHQANKLDMPWEMAWPLWCLSLPGLSLVFAGLMLVRMRLYSARVLYEARLLRMAEGR